jgi:hypothetical protein
MSSRATELLGSPIGLQLLADLHATKSRDAFDVLTRVQTEASRYRGDYDEHVRGLRSRAGQLAELAERIAAQQASWWDPLDRSSQVWLSPNPAEPTAAGFRVELRRFSLQTPKPLKAMWTSALFGGNSSMWLDHPEGPDEPFFWLLTVAPEARVVEINSPADWSEFATHYRDQTVGYTYAVNRRRTAELARVDPDWSSVAAEWDAVHLSIGGYLTAEDVPLTQDGVTTELRGWNLESTVWLRWAFDSCQRMG